MIFPRASALKGLVKYLEMCKISSFHLKESQEVEKTTMMIDLNTRNALELLPSVPAVRFRESDGVPVSSWHSYSCIVQGSNKVSLLKCIDKTVTAPGRRLLRKRLQEPLLDLHRINARLDLVEALTRVQRTSAAELTMALRGFPDLDRILNKLRGHTRADLIMSDSRRLVTALGDALQLIRSLETVVQEVESGSADQASRQLRQFYAKLERDYRESIQVTPVSRSILSLGPLTCPWYGVAIASLLWPF